MCGGTSVCHIQCEQRVGLSPRVRGNQYLIRRPAWRCGSIPACAGEPTSGNTFPCWDRVYPRVCGGTDAEVGLASTAMGLSPRVRGNRLGRRGGRHCHGSIPACAGEPVECASPGRPSRVYPRVCGGTERCNSRALGPRGLSPRVRGNHPVEPLSALIERSIPACAGEPIPGSGWFRQEGVYPRVCGGTTVPFVTPSKAVGLSPRVRGNPTNSVGDSLYSRSIPACAGEPLERLM